MSGQRNCGITANTATPLRVSELPPSTNASIGSTLDEAEFSALIAFFVLLDTWERQSHATEKL
jgi:hypothetical protein